MENREKLGLYMKMIYGDTNENVIVLQRDTCSKNESTVVKSMNFRTQN